MEAAYESVKKIHGISVTRYLHVSSLQSQFHLDKQCNGGAMVQIFTINTLYIVYIVHSDSSQFEMRVNIQ